VALTPGRAVFADRRALAQQLPWRRGRWGHRGRARHQDVAATSWWAETVEPFTPLVSTTSAWSGAADAWPQDSHPQGHQRPRRSPRLPGDTSCPPPNLTSKRRAERRDAVQVAVHRIGGSAGDRARL